MRVPVFSDSVCLYSRKCGPDVSGASEYQEGLVTRYTARLLDKREHLLQISIPLRGARTGRHDRYEPMGLPRRWTNIL